jgi:uncharacterized protein (DUF2249 family)
MAHECARRHDSPAAGGPPRELADVPEARRTRLDVREDIRRGDEPLARIMAVVTSLGDGHVLVLRAPFEPIPLYRVLGNRGFRHWTERHGDDDWTVSFYRETGDRAAARRETDAAPAPEDAPPGPAAHPRRVLDVRGLEPPEPMVQVLEEVERLGPGAELEVRHDRRPMFLYPQLDERGLVHETDEPAPGLVRIRIRRPEA